MGWQQCYSSATQGLGLHFTLLRRQGPLLGDWECLWLAGKIPEINKFTQSTIKLKSNQYINMDIHYININKKVVSHYITKQINSLIMRQTDSFLFVQIFSKF